VARKKRVDGKLTHTDVRVIREAIEEGFGRAGYRAAFAPRHQYLYRITTDPLVGLDTFEVAIENGTDGPIIKFKSSNYDRIPIVHDMLVATPDYAPAISEIIASMRCEKLNGELAHAINSKFKILRMRLEELGRLGTSEIEIEIRIKDDGYKFVADVRGEIQQEMAWFEREVTPFLRLQAKLPSLMVISEPDRTMAIHEATRESVKLLMAGKAQ
jgi:hypothetical protein